MNNMKSEAIHIRLSAELLEKIRTIADRETRPLAKQIEHLLKLAIKSQGE
jgi:hypothetical protein